MTPFRSQIKGFVHCYFGNLMNNRAVMLLSCKPENAPLFYHEFQRQESCSRVTKSFVLLLVCASANTPENHCHNAIVIYEQVH
jgi:hypothetical protein